MKKWIGLTFTAILLTSVCSAKEVNFLNWADYISPKTIPAFEKQTDITVNRSYFDGSDMLRAMLLAGGAGYDVIMPALVGLPEYIQADLLQPIDTSKIPNYKYRDQALYKLTERVDPGNKYGVIYTYGTTGIAFNKKLIKKYLGDDAPVDSWKILFEPKYLKKLQKCGISFLDSPTQVFGITLHYLGYNPNTQNKAELKKAAEYLMKIRKYLTYFSNNRYIYDIASGNLCIAMAYSGDTIRAASLAKQSGDHVELQYDMAKDGVPIWFDMLAIPKNAPHPEEALKFINALLVPKTAAADSNFIMQPNAVPESKPFLLPVLQKPNATPDAETLKSAFILHNATPQMQGFVSRLWFSVNYGVPLS